MGSAPPSGDSGDENEDVSMASSASSGDDSGDVMRNWSPVSSVIEICGFFLNECCAGRSLFRLVGSSVMDPRARTGGGDGPVRGEEQGEQYEEGE